MLSQIQTVPIARWLGIVLSLSLNAPEATAAKPVLAFDFGRTAECRDVTASFLEPSDSESALLSDQKVIELKVRVSVHLLRGKIDDVEEVRIELTDCDSRIRVENFSPDTRLQSDFSEDIAVTKTVENGKSLAASLGGEAPIPFGDVVAHVLPSVNGGLSNREVVTEKQTRVAPQYAVVASGTINQEHGVFFKLRSSSQTTLEGSHELTVQFLVPKHWRGDSLHVCLLRHGPRKVPVDQAAGYLVAQRSSASALPCRRSRSEARGGRARFAAQTVRNQHVRAWSLMWKLNPDVSNGFVRLCAVGVGDRGNFPVGLTR